MPMLLRSLDNCRHVEDSATRLRRLQWATAPPFANLRWVISPNPAAAPANPKSVLLLPLSSCPLVSDVLLPASAGSFPFVHSQRASTQPASLFLAGGHCGAARVPAAQLLPPEPDSLRGQRAPPPLKCSPGGVAVLVNHSRIFQQF